jgi:MerR family copper efflux transcriptional regulator
MRMRIGELQARSGTSRDTLRYYERIGLIAARRQPGNNYREYDNQTLEELAFIHQAQAMSFTQTEIRELLQARRSRLLDCARGAAMLGDKLAEVERRLLELTRLRNFLRDERERLLASAAQQAAANHRAAVAP